MQPTATYSPEDNKLRLYPVSRLDPDTYTRVKSAGFTWAPKQELFVAPMWTPEREDLLLELAGEIGDEDTSLVERAEQRAERFEDYSDNRREDAERAKEVIDVIAERFHMGQPILVGHHSEKRARKDAERITTGMRRAIKMWDQAQYWQDRAKGAIWAAKYKERPDVRARRIKGIEADIRRCKAEYTPADNPPRVIIQRAWNAEPDAAPVPHVWCAPKGGGGRGGKWVQVSRLAAVEAHYSRWIQHYENRLSYERAMLAGSGGTADGRPKAAAFDLQVGGRVLVGRDWSTVTKVNRKGGEVVSVSTNARYCRVKGLEEIQEYEAPSADQAEQVKAATALGPLCNYPGEGFIHCTLAQWNKIPKDHRGSVKIAATGTTGAHRVRRGFGVWLPLPMVTPAMDGTERTNHTHKSYPVYVTDEKRKDPPAPASVPAPLIKAVSPTYAPLAPIEKSAEEKEIEAMRETLRAGVQVVSAPQLFPTPPELAARMVDEANIESGQCVLEPSAGTGNLVRAVLDRVDTEVLAYEINPALCSQLGRSFPSYKLQVRCKDFLEVTDFAGCYERVLMNPPFANGQDIEHVRHAYHMLREGGRLVAIMSEGPFFRSDRKATEFRAWLDEIGGVSEQLPPETFKESGTGVNTRLVVIDR